MNSDDAGKHISNNVGFSRGAPAIITPFWPAAESAVGRKESVKIAVLSASRHKNCTLKDVAGGFGTVFTVGKSPFARLLELAKRRIAAIPNITLAYLDSILSATIVLRQGA